MNIISILHFIKKHILLFGGILAIIFIFLISNNIKKPTKSTVTVPVINNIEIPKISNLSVNYSHTFSNENRIQISDNQRIFAINKAGQLVILSDNKTIPISPINYNVVNFVTKGDTVLLETGVYQGENNSFYYYNLSNNINTKLNLIPIKPIISYSINPQQTNIAFLGKYISKSFTTNIYIFDIENEKYNIISENIQANNINWVDNNTLLVSKSLDKNEPNFYFSLINSSNNSVIAKDIPAVQKSISVNEKENQIFYIDSSKQILSSISIVDGKITEYFKLDSLNNEVVIFPNTKTIGILKKTNTHLTLQLIDLLKNTVIKTQNYPLSNNEQYIEKNYVNNQYFIKTFNTQTQQYQIKGINF